MRKRSKYRPRAVITNTMQIATHQAAIMHSKERGEMKGKATDAFDKLRRCEDVRQAWSNLVDALNIAEKLCDLRIAGNLRSEIMSGQHALSAQIERIGAGKGHALYPAEMAAIREALWVYYVQLDHCSAGEAQEAIKRVRDVGIAALSGNAASGVIVHTMPAEL